MIDCRRSRTVRIRGCGQQTEITATDQARLYQPGFFRALAFSARINSRFSARCFLTRHLPHNWERLTLPSFAVRGSIAPHSPHTP